MKRALYIGRFQGFHLGHLDVVQHMDAAPDIDEILIVLGSTQYDHQHKSPVAPWSHNPFTEAERREMIEAGLAGMVRKPWSLHPVPDYHDWTKWYAHIERHVPAYEVLYTSDAAEKRWFSEHGKEVRGFPRHRRFHAGSIRTWIAAGQDYRHAMPGPTADIVDRIAPRERLKALFEKDLLEVVAR